MSKVYIGIDLAAKYCWGAAPFFDMRVSSFEFRGLTPSFEFRGLTPNFERFGFTRLRRRRGVAPKPRATP